MCKLDESDLWPDVAQPRRTISHEVKALYRHRWAVPQTIWRRLFQGASRKIDILTHSNLFLAEDTEPLSVTAGRCV
ncbi:hypothetical protein [Microbispora bryophytorum]|uniref:hypothetical protein n=1 Tax=Microbispora bryophytorum TaxID=1460882 RepID=UPI0033FFE09E